MAGFFYKGIVLRQYKEPALSRDLREFFNTDTTGRTMDWTPVDRPEELSPAQLLAVAAQARIVDERDGAPLAGKLEEALRHPPRLLVGDAIDDEPYVSSQLSPLLKLPREAADGLRLAQRICGASQAEFAVYKNLADLEIKIPRQLEEFPVRRIRGRYPAEYQAAQQYDRAEDTLLIGVCALIHLSRAVRLAVPQTTAFLTVAGNCIGNPCNLEVSLGMTVAQVLDRCGLIEDPARVVVGGPMTGISVIDTGHTVITPTTRAVLAFLEDFQAMGFQCIGCARCVRACPQGLDPFYLYHSALKKQYALFRKLDAQKCIGCGTCSYMCPSKLELAQVIQQARQAFRPALGSMRTFSALRRKKEQADLDCYLLQDKLRRAERAQKRRLQNQEQSVERRIKELQNAASAAARQLDQEEQQAKAACQEAQRLAEQQVAQLRAKLEQGVPEGEPAVTPEQVSQAQEAAELQKQESAAALELILAGCAQRRQQAQAELEEQLRQAREQGDQERAGLEDQLEQLRQQAQEAVRQAARAQALLEGRDPDAPPAPKPPKPRKAPPPPPSEEEQRQEQAQSLGEALEAVDALAPELEETPLGQTPEADAPAGPDAGEASLTWEEIPEEDLGGQAVEEALTAVAEAAQEAPRRGWRKKRSEKKGENQA